MMDSSPELSQTAQVSPDPYFEIPYSLRNRIVYDVREALCEEMQRQDDADENLTVDFTTRCDYAATVTGDIEYGYLAKVAVNAVYKSLGKIIGSLEVDDD